MPLTIPTLAYEEKQMSDLQILVDNTIEQMKIDIASEDWTAIEELLRQVALINPSLLHGFMSDIQGEAK
jgi:hypothetical protein